MKTTEKITLTEALELVREEITRVLPAEDGIQMEFT